MRQDRIIRFILMLVAFSAIAGLALIAFFIFKEGVPLIFQVGWRDFFLSSEWHPSEGLFGVFAMIMGTLMVTAGAMLIGGVFGLSLAIVMTQFSGPRLAGALKPVIELLAGIPSVVYGFIGVKTIVPLIRDHLGGPGLSVLACSIVLGVMVLPTVASISIDAFRAVPRSFWEGSLALGATRWQTTCMVMLKAARSGLVAAVILGMGRAVGETMAVIMVAGNSLAIPDSILAPVRTLTSNIALEMGYASGLHRKALFAAGVTLFVIIMILNTAAITLSSNRARAKGGAK
ncbi:MAG: phosphate ABC transporter permease subunit PstC [Lentisphaerae bacterium]|nr:phosphate ABC transporter permease subunit PstC [Lentisphaerota bacterium]